MLTASILRERLQYDPDAGVFTRRGKVAGCPNGRGYLVIRIDYKLYYAQRLAWLYMTGEWPVDEIDHRDLDHSNNRWSNLREASHGQNAHNTGLRSNNTSGKKGVSFRRDRGKWRATIAVDQKQIHLGHFLSREEAVAAHQIAAAKFHGEYARTA